MIIGVKVIEESDLGKENPWIVLTVKLTLGGSYLSQVLLYFSAASCLNLSHAAVPFFTRYTTMSSKADYHVPRFIRNACNEHISAILKQFFSGYLYCNFFYLSASTFSFLFVLTETTERPTQHQINSEKYTSSAMTNHITFLSTLWPIQI